MKHYHVLNLGAGVQSTTLALLAMQGRLLNEDGGVIKFDCAIFSDTQEEPEDPGHSVYEHLNWLEAQLSFPIHRVTAGKLGENLMYGTGASKRCASIPAFTKHRENGKLGKTKRQCTREYKIAPIETAIRRKVLGLEPRKWIPKTTTIHQYIGISLDEAGRMLKAQKRQQEKPVRWAQFHYPLIQQLQWTRGDCRSFLAPLVPHRVPRSACVFCPFHDNEEWKSIKARNGKDWARSVEIDEMLRKPDAVATRGLEQEMFLHRSCIPLKDIDFDSIAAKKVDDIGMAAECEGMCGH